MEFLHKNITDKIIKAFYKVYNELGFGFLEKVYENALYLKLKTMSVCSIRYTNIICVALALTMLLSNCDNPGEDVAGPLFKSHSSVQTGIDFINRNEENDSENILTYEYFYNGGGVAVGDINNDGLVDIYFSANQGENKLYLNQGNFKFKDITQTAGVGSKKGWSTGVAMVDINGDGYLDIYVCRSGNNHPVYRKNHFYINNQDLTFTDRSKEMGLDDDSYSTQAAFFDYDRDGDLDVFVLNHSRLTISNSYDISARHSHQRIRYVSNKLFRNDHEIFHEISDSVGIFGRASNYGLGIAYADLNGDGWVDLYLSNDFTSNDELLINKNGKFFQDSSDSLLTHMSQFSMGVDISDINNDGLPDILTLDMLPENNERQKGLFWPDKYDVYNTMVANGLHHQYMRNMLQLNNGDGTFSEIGQLAGIANTDWSWGPLVADFDNDGFQDLFVTNGFKRNFTDNDFLNFKSDLVIQAKQGRGSMTLSEVLELIPTGESHNYIFRNINGIEFKDMSESWGFGEMSLSNGAAYADLDNDGDLDIVVNNLEHEAGMFENLSKPGKHFLKVRLKGKDKNVFALGATVTVYTGEQLMVRTQNPFRGFQSSIDYILHFGLDSVTVVDSLVIRWPDGGNQVVERPAIDQLIQIDQIDNRDEALNSRVVNKNITYLKSMDEAIHYIHQENDFIDFDIQSLLFRMYSTQGPALAIGDINGEGQHKAVFFGGAKGQEDALFSLENGVFKQLAWQKGNEMSEAVDAVFFDADNDGDQDLYVVNGGYEYNMDDRLLQDKLYINHGKGNYTIKSLPEFPVSGGCVRPADVDGDGDMDLFIGSRVVPGRYPESPVSHMLINDGHGNFSIQTDVIAPSFKTLGMVTDAIWLDLNNDNRLDLMVVGEWMPVTVFLNENGNLFKSNAYFEENTSGWWNRILAADFDEDGDQDLVIGNFGINNQLKASRDQPVTLYYSDFDHNGSVDPIMNYFIGGKSYPSPTKDELTRQLPLFKKRFNDYKSYTTATIEDVLTQDEIQNASILRAELFKTSYFKNEGGRFVRKDLPIALQTAPVFALGAMDVNQDGHLDLLAAGNLSHIRARFGKAVGNFGTIFLGDGNGGFTYSFKASDEFKIRGDVRNLVTTENQIIVAINNGSPVVYKLDSGALLAKNKQNR